jgi:cellulose synthase/poly-beta-1,6-N-acetylglucosamine synthase-like glycosyltransferase
MFAKTLLWLFVGFSALLWLLTFGYLLILRGLAVIKHRVNHEKTDLPKIAVIIPTLNEEAGILHKIEDMTRSNYPKELINLVIVDGGSQDRTVDLVKEKISSGMKINLIRLNDHCNKVDQINHILTNRGEDIIVFTDADSSLDPSCIKELVRALTSDPRTALIGANVKPRTRFFEERIHWLLLNYFWWLEGEVFSSSGISGVCYAVNRSIFFTIAKDAVAEDIHLGLDISARGRRVRICRRAVAYELRVPRGALEFIQYRRRRGASYVRELRRSSSHPHIPLGWKLARGMRLCQFTWVSWIGLAAAVTGCFLLLSTVWPPVLAVGTVFLFSLIGSLRMLANHEQDKPGLLTIVPAALRYAVLLLYSLFLIKTKPTHLGPLGGKEAHFDKCPTN